MQVKGRKIVGAFVWLLLAASLLLQVHVVRKVFFFERFSVSGNSMEPTYHNGEKVWVNKLLMGARINEKTDGSHGSLECSRLRGIRRLRVGDVAVLNMPYGSEWGRISFTPDYVFLKRCVGCPGDTISIEDDRYCNSRLGYDVGVPESATAALRATPDSVLLQNRMLKAGHFAGMQNEWTVHEFGPYAIPYKGETVCLDEPTVKMYSEILEYEKGSPVEADGSLYSFRHDWYFFAGDNMAVSCDSRLFGAVPDDYVVGIVR